VQNIVQNFIREPAISGSQKVIWQESFLLKVHYNPFLPFRPAKLFFDGFWNGLPWIFTIRQQLAGKQID
jgi:hypothetical protein